MISSIRFRNSGRKVCFRSVKSHGGTDAFGFSIAVENAARLVRKDFVGSIRRELENIDLDELSQEACYEVY